MLQFDFESQSTVPWPVWATWMNPKKEPACVEAVDQIKRRIRAELNNTKPELAPARSIATAITIHGASRADLLATLSDLYNAQDTVAAHFLIQMVDQVRSITKKNQKNIYQMLLPINAPRGLPKQLNGEASQQIEGQLQDWYGRPDLEIAVSPHLITMAQVQQEWPWPSPMDSNTQHPFHPWGTMPGTYWMPLQVAVPDKEFSQDRWLWWKWQICADFTRDWRPLASQFASILSAQSGVDVWIDRPRPAAVALQRGIRENDRRHLREAAKVALSSGFGTAQVALDAYVIEREQHHLQLWITFRSNGEILYGTTWTIFDSPLEELNRAYCTLSHMGWEIVGVTKLHSLRTTAALCARCGEPLFPVPNNEPVHAYGGHSCKDQTN